MATANAFCDHSTNSPIFNEGTMLAKDLIGYKLGRNAPPVNATARTLRKLSDDIEVKNPDLLEQLCSKLNFSSETGYSSFSEIAKEVFSDGVINWGRIAVLFAFGAKLGKYCSEHNMNDQIENISNWTARFITGLGWIEQQGGWVGTYFSFYYKLPTSQQVFARKFFEEAKANALRRILHTYNEMHHQISLPESDSVSTTFN